MKNYRYVVIASFLPVLAWIALQFLGWAAEAILLSSLVLSFLPLIIPFVYHLGSKEKNSISPKGPVKEAEDILDYLTREHEKNNSNGDVTLMTGDVLKELHTTIGLRTVHMTSEGPVVDYSVLREIRAMINIQKGNYV